MRPPRHRPTGPQLRPHVEPVRVGELTPDEAAPTAPTAPPADPGSPEVPKYARMEVRDARLRPDQWRDLRDLVDRLKATRTDRRERLTHNTLLRIAVDLLLARADELHGDDEAALRASVGLPEHPH